MTRERNAQNPTTSVDRRNAIQAAPASIPSGGVFVIAAPYGARLEHSGTTSSPPHRRGHHRTLSPQKRADLCATAKDPFRTAGEVISGR